MCNTYRAPSLKQSAITNAAKGVTSSAKSTQCCVRHQAQYQVQSTSPATGTATHRTFKRKSRMTLQRMT
jgi:hypothetical protein